MVCVRGVHARSSRMVVMVTAGLVLWVAWSGCAPAPHLVQITVRLAEEPGLPEYAARPDQHPVELHWYEFSGLGPDRPVVRLGLIIAESPVPGMEPEVVAAIEKRVREAGGDAVLGLTTMDHAWDSHPPTKPSRWVTQGSVVRFLEGADSE